MKLWKSLTGYQADKAYDKIYELFLHDNFTEVNKEGQIILKQRPTHQKTMLLLGQIALIKRQRARAWEWYHKALELNIWSAEARLGRGDASFGKKHYEAALEDYLILYESSRKNFLYMQKLGTVYVALGLPTIALRYFQKAVDFAPAHIEVQFMLIKHQLSMKHYGDAEKQLQIAKDHYYHHKSSLNPLIFEEIQKLEKQIGRYLHKKNKVKS